MGVQEYNIIHQDGRFIQYGLSDGKYDIVSSLTKVEDYKSIVFDNLKFSLKDIFDYWLYIHPFSFCEILEVCNNTDDSLLWVASSGISVDIVVPFLD